MPTPILHVLIVFAVCTFLSCGGDDDRGFEPQTKDRYAFVVPEHFPAPEFDLVRDPVTKEGFLLGKKLFEEVRISRTRDISCGSCHAQTVAFADPQHRLSVGVDNRIGSRNAPQLTNLAFAKTFFLDGGVTHLDFVPQNALEAFHEMDITLEEAVERLKGFPEYRPLFAAAYGTDSITSARMFKAWTQYMRRMVSAGSKWDRHVLNLDDGDFTPEESSGMDVFEAKCSSCHGGALFTDQTFRNNGLDSTFTDVGRATISEVQSDIGKFKVPSLRNLERTAPYMHDGRFGTLREVLEHYRSGIQASETLDPSLANGIPLSDEEVDQLEAFLYTLTDWEFVRDTLF